VNAKRPWMFLKRCLLTALVLLVCLLIAFPYVMKSISLPHNSMRFDRAVEDMAFIATALKDYQREHSGLRPESLYQLKLFVSHNSTYNEVERHGAMRLGCQYFPQAKNAEPVIVSVLPSQAKNVILWIDSRGDVRASLIRKKWPIWKLSNGSLKAKW